MATKTKVYVDTSALIAFQDGSDSYHQLFVRLFAEPSRLITSSLVVAEGHGWFLRRYDIARALEFMDFIHQLKPLEVVAIGNQEIQASARYLRKYSDQTLTLVDACGLWMMEKYGIKTCWSTDFHLGLTGVPLIIHET